MYKRHAHYIRLISEENFHQNILRELEAITQKTDRRFIEGLNKLVNNPRKIRW